jgi:putative ABC transport system permease protein
MATSHHASASTSSGIWTGALTDFRHAVRLLWKSKGITATTLLTLALGIGATTAIFSTVYSLTLKPLPYQEPERIVELYTSAANAGLHHMPANVPFYIDYSRNATSYESVGLWTFFYSLVGDKDAVVRTPGVRMTAEIFSILRIRPLHGTFFTKEQNKPGADKVIVLTQSYWRSQYQESPEVWG